MTWNHKDIVRKRFSAEEHTSRNQKTRNGLCTVVSVDSRHVEIYQCVVHDKKAQKTIALKM